MAEAAYTFSFSAKMWRSGDLVLDCTGLAGGKWYCLKEKPRAVLVSAGQEVLP